VKSRIDWTAVVIDDHLAVRDMTRRLIEAAGHRVLGEAATAAEGIEVVRELDPDVVVLDIVLPDQSGFDVARTLKDDGTDATIVLMSSHELDDLGGSVEESGADAFISKSDISLDSLRALEVELKSGD